jgi:hypothetical protein
MTRTDGHRTRSSRKLLLLSMATAANLRRCMARKVIIYFSLFTDLQIGESFDEAAAKFYGSKQIVKQEERNRVYLSYEEAKQHAYQ